MILGETNDVYHAPVECGGKEALVGGDEGII